MNEVRRGGALETPEDDRGARDAKLDWLHGVRFESNERALFEALDAFQGLADAARFGLKDDEKEPRLGEFERAEKFRAEKLPALMREPLAA